MNKSEPTFIILGSSSHLQETNSNKREEDLLAMATSQWNRDQKKKKKKYFWIYNISRDLSINNLGVFIIHPAVLTLWYKYSACAHF